LYSKAADGSGVAELITESGQGFAFVSDVSSDGGTLFYNRLDDRSPGQGIEIWAVPIGEGVSEGELLLGGEGDQRNATLSPDGRWLAYQSNEAGPTEVYVVPYPDVGSSLHKVSTNGGSHPHWSDDGTELFYLRLGFAANEAARISGSGTLMSVSIDAGTDFTADVPQPLFGNRFFAPDQYRVVFDVSPEGNFLMIQGSAQGGGDPGSSMDQIVIVEHFDELVKQQIPTD
jgi:hypothetical protein